jgi:TM2 domain-containing membrane protein YozV
MSHVCESQIVRIEQDREHNVVAAALSVALPGMGHIYKGRYGTGIAILLLGAPLSLWVGVLLSLATLGLGLFIPVFYWAMTAVSAYYAEDHRAHHAFNVI